MKSFDLKIWYKNTLEIFHSIYKHNPSTFFLIFKTVYHLAVSIIKISSSSRISCFLYASLYFSDDSFQLNIIFNTPKVLIHQFYYYSKLFSFPPQSIESFKHFYYKFNFLKIGSKFFSMMKNNQNISFFQKRICFAPFLYFLFVAFILYF